MNKNKMENSEFKSMVMEKVEPIIEMSNIKNNVSVFFYQEPDGEGYYTKIKGLNHDEAFTNKMKFIDELNKANESIIFASGKPLVEAVDNVTTVRVHQSTMESLKNIKISPNESYEATIRRLIMYYRENNHEF